VGFTLFDVIHHHKNKMLYFVFVLNISVVSVFVKSVFIHDLHRNTHTKTHIYSRLTP